MRVGRGCKRPASPARGLRIAFRKADDDDLHSIRVAAAGRYRLMTKDNIIILDLGNGCIA